jgi:hypothetical protein
VFVYSTVLLRYYGVTLIRSEHRILHTAVFLLRSPPRPWRRRAVDTGMCVEHELPCHRQPPPLTTAPSHHTPMDRRPTESPSFSPSTPKPAGGSADRDGRPQCGVPWSKQHRTRDTLRRPAVRGSTRHVGARRASRTPHSCARANATQRASAPRAG